MDEQTAIEALCKEFGIEGGRYWEFRTVWDNELAWEREWIKSRHPRTRGQYMLAIGNTQERLRDWLNGNGPVPKELQEGWGKAKKDGTVPGIPTRQLMEILLTWEGTTRKAAVWCGLWWLRKQMKWGKGK